MSTKTKEPRNQTSFVNSGLYVQTCLIKQIYQTFPPIINMSAPLINERPYLWISNLLHFVHTLPHLQWYLLICPFKINMCKYMQVWTS